MLQEVSKLHSSMGNFNDAMKAVEDALPLYVDLGDALGKASATEMVGAVEDARAAMEYEAERKKAVKENLEKLKSALQTRNGELFKEVIESLYSDENVLLEDVEGIIEPMMEKDADGTLEFMRENHPEGLLEEEEEAAAKTVHESGGVYSAEGERLFDKSWHYDRRFFYFMFRTTGMGYGPGLRTLRTGFRLGSQENQKPGNLPFGVSTMMLKDDHDDWEQMAGWHPGLHDCALQSGGMRGYDLQWCRDMTRNEPGNFRFDPNKRYTAS